MLIFAQSLRFFHRIGSHVYLSVLCIKAQFARQRIGAAILFGGKDIGILPIAHPRHGNRALSRIREANGSIMVLAIVQPFSHFGFCVTFKFLSVKVADKILCSATSKHASRIDIDNQCPLHAVLITVHRQLNKIGALKLAGLYSVTFTETAHKLPVFQVPRRIETHLFVGRYHHHPFLVGFIPKDLRVTEVFQSVKRSQNGIVFVFGIGTSIVGAVCHALNLTILVTGRSIESNHCIFTVACAVLCIHHCTPREDMSQSIPCNGRVKMFPMHQVLAHGMSPMHIPPYRTVRIILEIKVIFTVFINQPVGVIHPAIKRSVMINGTEFVSVCCIKGICDLNAVPTKGIGCHILHNNDSFSGSLR